MGWEDYVDQDIISDPIYWAFTGVAEFGMMLGFKAQGLWGNGGMPLWQKIIILVLLPVASYFIYMKMRTK